MRCKGNAFFGTGKLFGRFFSKKLLIHPIFIVRVVKFAQEFQSPVLMKHADGGMANAIEHVRLHGCIVDHILKDYLLAHLQLMVELPIFHKVATQTTVAAQSVEVRGMG